MKTKLVLEDGSVFNGKSFGAQTEASGEVVFNTSITGYQEVLTDPSYHGQIVIMTYPLVGNYGVNAKDFESNKPRVAGFVVKEYNDFFSNWRATGSLGNFLEENNIPGIWDIDTRALTRHIRSRGAMRGMISSTGVDEKALLEKVRHSQQMAGADLVKFVSTRENYQWKEDLSEEKYRVIAFDFGIKYNILRQLNQAGCLVTVVPAETSAEEVLRMNPDGIFLSNGPGDPAAVTYAISTIKNLIGKKPIFGICLGHQLLAWAFGGRTFKLKFGHRGINHPVKNLKTERIEITTQNHGFAVDPHSLKDSEVEMTHLNLNDYTNEGFRSKNYPIFSVQYHPEAAPGPHDSHYLFQEFIRLIEHA